MFDALSSDDAQISAAAAMTAAFVPELADEFRDWANEHLDGLGDARASVMFALKLVRAEAFHADPRDALERSAMQLADLLDGTSLKAELAPVLADETQARFPWFRRNFVWALQGQLSDSKRALAIVKCLEAPLQQLDPARFALAAEVLLKICGLREQCAEDDVLLVEELSELQLACAHVMARKDGWTLGGLWGLPVSGRDRRRWLGIDPPGPLEKLIKQGAKRLPVWKVWRDSFANQTARSWIPNVIQQALDPIERAEAVNEIELAGYGIAMIPELAETSVEEMSPDDLLALGQACGKAGAKWALRRAELLRELWNQEGPESSSKGAELADCYLFSGIFIAGGVKWTTELYEFVPAEPPHIARLVLNTISPSARAEAVARSVDHLFRAKDGRCIPVLMPIIDLVPSPRFVAELTKRLRDKSVRERLKPNTANGEPTSPSGPELAEAYLAKLASLHPS